MTSRIRRLGGATLLAAGLASAAVLVAPGAAYAASSAGVSGTVLRVQAEAGKANAIEVGMVNTTIQIVDRGDVLTAGAGCVSINRNTVECDATSVTRIEVDTLDGDDTVESAVLLDSVLRGGDGSDRLVSAGRADVLDGGAGNDVLDAGAGDDTLRGGPDADTMNGGTGRDTMDGGTGPDVFNGGTNTGADRDTADYSSRTAAVTADIDGVADDGEAGEGDNLMTDMEVIIGGSAGDTLTGSNIATMPNRLDGGPGADTMIGLAGQDDMVGREGADRFFGGDGPDNFFPGPGGDTMSGGAGDDEVFYNDKPNGVRVTIDGVANDGENSGAEGDNVGLDVEDISGSPGADFLFGSDAGNALTGGTGDDFIDGKGGADFVGGAGGDDTLRGGDGDDGLQGGPDNDDLEGGRGNDRLNGNDGDDVLRGGVLGAGNDGADTLVGDFGFDTVDYNDHGGLAVMVTMDDLANDGALGANEGDNVSFGVERVIGSMGADTLIGNGDPNVLVGGDRNIDGGDNLIGNGGNDELRGHLGNDTVNCGAGLADLGDGGGGTGDQVPPGHGCETLLGVP